MDSRRSLIGSLGITLLVAQLTLFAKCPVSAQDCLLAAEGSETPFRDVNLFSQLPSETQAIITSYKFECCGNITSWQTYVQPGGGSNQGAYDIGFQVWRPSPTVQENGCYSLVGQNRFSSILLGIGGLVSETPEPSNILTVQPGDVVGYFTFSRKGTNEGIQLDDSLAINSVWYHTNSDSEPLITGPPDCPLPVGTEVDRILKANTKAAPILSVNVSSFSCPPTTTISPSSTSSLPPSKTTNSISPVDSATTISPTTNAVTLVNTNYESSAALSTAVIASVAAVGGSALLLTLLCTLLLAIILVKVQHKRQRAVAETSSIVTDQQVNTLFMEMNGNEAYTTTSLTASSINTESNLAYETANTLSMRMQGNEAYTTTSHTTNECSASTVNTESDQVYEAVNMECED